MALSKAQLIQTITEKATEFNLDVDVTGKTVPQLQELLRAVNIESGEDQQGTGTEGNDQDDTDQDQKITPEQQAVIDADLKAEAEKQAKADEKKAKSKKVKNNTARIFVIGGTPIKPGEEFDTSKLSESDTKRINHAIKCGTVSKC
jgi:hypothetical protein